MSRRPCWNWLVGLLLLLALCVGGLTWWSLGSPSRRTVVVAIDDARKQGFPADYSDFGLTTTVDERRRAQVTTNAGAAWRPVGFSRANHWMSPVAPGAAGCGWTSDSDWDVLATELDLLSLRLDRAVVALLKDAPLRFFPAQRDEPLPLHLDPHDPITAAGRRWPSVELGELLLPHLNELKSLEAALTARMALDLRSGLTREAWTNLLALTALALRFEPEPTEASHLARASLVQQAYVATWEALRTNVWTDGQLAELANQWKRPNFWVGVPEIPALSAMVLRSFAANARLEYGGQSPIRNGLPQIIRFARSNPTGAWSAFRSLLKFAARQNDYLQHGSYGDEMIMLKFARERREELRRAIAAPNWLAMRSLPGATNVQPIQLTAGSPLQDLMNVRAIWAASARFNAGVPSALASAAETEALRRVLITALAVERYRLKSGQLPDALLALPGAEPDFITGTPLQYRPSGRDFLLYSVGLNSRDDGGEMVASRTQGASPAERPDLVWPRVATPEEVEAAQAERRGNASPPRTR